ELEVDNIRVPSSQPVDYFYSGVVCASIIYKDDFHFVKTAGPFQTRKTFFFEISSIIVNRYNYAEFFCSESLVLEHLVFLGCDYLHTIEIITVGKVFNFIQRTDALYVD